MSSKKVFLFNGQGAQQTGMGYDFCQSSSSAKEVFETADKAAGRKISELCFTGSEEELKKTVNTQPCVLTVDLAIAAAMAEQGIRPDIAAGFSLGEYAALVSAGVLRTEDAVRIIQIRAEAMQQAVPEGAGAMAAVKKCDEELLTSICKEAGEVWPVNFNSPEQIVISGYTEAVENAVARLKELKYRAVLLPVSAPFHTPLMHSAMETLEKEFKDIEFKDASIPVYMNYDGKAETRKDEIRRKLLLQTVSPVQWTTTLRSIAADTDPEFYELGPGTTLSAFTFKTLGIKARSIGTAEQLKEACSCD